MSAVGELIHAGSLHRLRPRFCDIALRGNLLQQLQPFTAQAVIELHKAGDIAAWPRQTCDNACAYRVDSDDEHDRHGSGRFEQLRDCLTAYQDGVRYEPDQLSGMSIKLLCVSFG